MKTLILAVAACAVFAPSPSTAVNAQDATARPEASAKPQARQVGVARRVEGRMLTSERMPPIKIDVDKAFEYAGSQEFVLYDSAQVEQYFFVVPDKERRVKRLIMMQFEGYLPNNTHTYNYHPEKTVKLGAMEFTTDFSVGSAELVKKHRPGSDVDRAVSYLESKGYRAGGDFMSQRFVRLVDDAKRNEVIVLYIEDMSDTGLTAADFAEGGRAAAQKQSIQEGLLSRALKSFTVTEK